MKKLRPHTSFNTKNTLQVIARPSRVSYTRRDLAYLLLRLELTVHWRTPMGKPGACAVAANQATKTCALPG